MADTRVGWVPEPTGRGMVGLIYNCLFTIFLCTWTANRRKVPKANAGISLMHAFYFSSNAIVAETTDGHRQLASFSLAQNLIIHCYPSLFTISKEEIEDKSKADTVARAITLLQTVWFATQVIGRVAQHFSISTLEIFTISILINYIVSFIFWWHKLKDVSTVTIIKTDMTWEEFKDFIRRYHSPVQIIRKAYILFAILLVVFACLSAGTPLLALHFSFPTPAERLIWIVFAVTSSVAVAGMLFGLMLNVRHSPGTFHNMVDWIVFPMLILYTPLQFYFVIEAFLGLRSSPAGLHRSVDWSLYICTTPVATTLRNAMV